MAKLEIDIHRIEALQQAAEDLLAACYQAGERKAEALAVKRRAEGAFQAIANRCRGTYGDRWQEIVEKREPQLHRQAQQARAELDKARATLEAAEGRVGDLEARWADAKRLAEAVEAYADQNKRQVA